MQAGGRPASEEVLATVERLVHSIAPSATKWGDEVVPKGYTLPGERAPFLLLRATETGVDVIVPDASGSPFICTFEAVDDVGWSDFEHALRATVASAEARAFHPRRSTDTFGGGTSNTAFPRAVLTVSAFFLFDAVRWQRVGIVALVPWAIIALLVGLAAARAVGEAPETSSLAGILALVVGAGGWVLTVRWAHRRFPPTAAQQEAATRADSEFLRTQSATVGCLAGGAWLFVVSAVLAVLGPEATRGRTGQVATVIMVLGIAAIPIFATRYVRRRYPPGPQTGSERVADVLMLLLLLIVVALGFYSVLTTPLSR